MSERDERGFTIISEADAMKRLTALIEDWRRRQLPDTAYAGVTVGDLRRLWERAQEVEMERVTEVICAERVARREDREGAQAGNPNNN